MASPKGLLTPNQLALAQAFFRHTTGFFLTGGAVLAGWELAHRSTDDLDLFTDSDVGSRAKFEFLLTSALSPTLSPAGRGSEFDCFSCFS